MSNEEINVVGIRFYGSQKVYSFDGGDFTLPIDTYVVVETSDGLAFGKVSKLTDDRMGTRQLSKVVRIATDRDKQRFKKTVDDKRSAIEACEKFVEQRKLEMRVSDVEFAFDESKVTFFFTAEERVDFRDLVKDLASYFHSRIDLRQIGVRDECKKLGGVAPCGRPCCCAAFLKDYAHSSVKMAKNQGLSLNPQKISGLCGRLMCCLAYENDHYVETGKKMPRIGSDVKTKDGDAVVISNDLLRETVRVRIQIKEQIEIREYALAEIGFEKASIGNFRQDIPTDLSEKETIESQELSDMPYNGDSSEIENMMNVQETQVNYPKNDLQQEQASDNSRQVPSEENNKKRHRDRQRNRFEKKHNRIEQQDVEQLGQQSLEKIEQRPNFARGGYGKINQQDRREDGGQTKLSNELQNRRQDANQIGFTDGGRNRQSDRRQDSRHNRLEKRRENDANAKVDNNGRKNEFRQGNGQLSQDEFRRNGEQRLSYGNRQSDRQRQDGNRQNNGQRSLDGNRQNDGQRMSDRNRHNDRQRQDGNRQNDRQRPQDSNRQNDRQRQDGSRQNYGQRLQDENRQNDRQRQDDGNRHNDRQRLQDSNRQNDRQRPQFGERQSNNQRFSNDNVSEPKVERRPRFYGGIINKNDKDN